MAEEIKLCVNCKHHRRPSAFNEIRTHRCDRPMWIDNEVAGVHSFPLEEPCSMQRSGIGGSYCGAEAKFYEPSIWKRIKNVFGIRS